MRRVAEENVEAWKQRLGAFEGYKARLEFLREQKGNKLSRMIQESCEKRLQALNAELKAVALSDDKTADEKVQAVSRIGGAIDICQSLLDDLVGGEKQLEYTKAQIQKYKNLLAERKAGAVVG